MDAKNMNRTISFFLNVVLAAVYVVLLIPLVEAIKYFPNSSIWNDIAYWNLGPAGSLTNHWIIYFEVVASAPIFAYLAGVRFWKAETWYKFREGLLLPLGYVLILYAINGFVGYTLLGLQLNNAIVYLGLMGIGIFITKNLKMPIAVVLCCITPYLYWGSIGSPYTMAATQTAFYYNYWSNMSEIGQWTFMLMACLVFLAIQVRNKS